VGLLVISYSFCSTPNCYRFLTCGAYTNGHHLLVKICTAFRHPLIYRGRVSFGYTAPASCAFATGQTPTSNAKTWAARLRRISLIIASRSSGGQTVEHARLAYGAICGAYLLTMPLHSGTPSGGGNFRTPNDRRPTWSRLLHRRSATTNRLRDGSTSGMTEPPRRGCNPKLDYPKRPGGTGAHRTTRKRGRSP
jgi:hypothetical protein